MLPKTKKEKKNNAAKLHKKESKIKNKDRANINRSFIKVNGDSSINKQNHFKKNNKLLKKPVLVQAGRVNNNTQFKLAVQSNNSPNSSVGSKKPNKRKFDQVTTGTTETNFLNNKISSNDVAARPPKKKKIEDVNQEGTILLEHNLKKTKKKRKQIVGQSIQETLHETKSDKRKEKIRQILQLENGRSQISVSGNKLRQRMLERLKCKHY